MKICCKRNVSQLLIAKKKIVRYFELFTIFVVKLIFKGLMHNHINKQPYIFQSNTVFVCRMVYQYLSIAIIKQCFVVKLGVIFYGHATPKF